IRDFHVTGVQTCALPIYHQRIEQIPFRDRGIDGVLAADQTPADPACLPYALRRLRQAFEVSPLHVAPRQAEGARLAGRPAGLFRSEERRVGEEWSCGSGP